MQLWLSEPKNKRVKEEKKGGNRSGGKKLIIKTKNKTDIDALRRI